MVNTRAGKRYGHDDYVNSGCGMGYEATMYLLERGVRLTGTDAWSWDAPFVHTKEKYEETHDRLAHLGRPQGWPRHRLLPPREAAQSRGAARRRLHGELLSVQDPRGICRLDSSRGDFRELTTRAHCAPCNLVVPEGHVPTAPAFSARSS